MYTYLVLNLAFMIVVVAALLLFRALRWNIAMTYTLIILLILTIIFDSLLILIGIFDYAPDKILGIRLGIAPIEDMTYAVLAVVMIPAIWKKLEAKRNAHD